MSLTRVYLPLSAAGLRRLAQARTLEPAPAFAVTEEVRAADPTGDEEAWEYAALADAVDAAGELREGEDGRRVVAAADVEETAVGPAAGTPDLAPSAVTVSEVVPLSAVVSFHVDEDTGAEDLDDLLWYDVTELDEVVRLLAR